MEVGIYVPQVVLSFQDMRHRAERCGQLGIRSLWLYDPLGEPPNAAGEPHSWR
jgi:hypothetical protein